MKFFINILEQPEKDLPEEMVRREAIIKRKL